MMLLEKGTEARRLHKRSEAKEGNCISNKRRESK